MYQLRPVLSLYFLSVYFFTLANSPNINGERIGVVLVVVFLSLIPVANFITCIPRSNANFKGIRWYNYFVLLILFLIGLVLSYTISWQFYLIQFIYLIIYYTIDKVSFPKSLQISSHIAIGALLFTVIYIGLNQYAFSRLFSYNNLIRAILSGLIIAPVLYLDGKKRDLNYSIALLLLGIETISFGIFFALYFNWVYSVLFIVAIIPSSILLIRTKRNNQSKRKAAKLIGIKLSYTLALIAFFIFFFLESTQVLQAIRGGY